MTHPSAQAALQPLTSLDHRRFETTPILKAALGAARRLAELKGVAGTIPNQDILLSTLALQEAKDSSAIENIVTTHDDVFKSDVLPESSLGTATKEVRHYTQALQAGYRAVRERGLLSTKEILEIQRTIEGNDAGFRKLPGTSLRDLHTGRVIYTPPQDAREIVGLMTDLESFINDETRFEADPLVKMAIIHHQFESIHPFYDGNGRTGRIINVLYLVMRGLLDIPVLYMSRQIVRSKTRYYELLQQVRDEQAWEEWTLYMLHAVEITAGETIDTIAEIRKALLDYKHRLRDGYKFYSQDLVNNLFTHPYTRIEFLMRDLGVSRLTATKYLDTLARDGLLVKRKEGRASYYMNVALVDALVRAER
jgi:Fic family protein